MHGPIDLLQLAHPLKYPTLAQFPGDYGHPRDCHGGALDGGRYLPVRGAIGYRMK